MAQETVLITGASSGIGRELARCFSADGARIALTARSGGPLQELAAELRKKRGLDARVFIVDLSRAEGPVELFNLLQTAGLKPDIVK
jgi:short-subunit dehydrogenase